jgi:hypothetical protein
MRFAEIQPVRRGKPADPKMISAASQTNVNAGRNPDFFGGMWMGADD